jgi:hypothetical protein
MRHTGIRTTPRARIFGKTVRAYAWTSPDGHLRRQQGRPDANGLSIPLLARTGFLQTQTPPKLILSRLSLLEDIHAENPNATFVLNFRPICDWIHSVRTWKDLLERYQK